MPPLMALKITQVERVCQRLVSEAVQRQCNLYDMPDCDISCEHSAVFAATALARAVADAWDRMQGLDEGDTDTQFFHDHNAFDQEEQ